MKVIFEIDGANYWWRGWFGAQLTSHERTNLKVGSVRRILGYDMAIFSVVKKGWFKYETNWSLNLLGLDIDDSQKKITELRNTIVGLI